MISEVCDRVGRNPQDIRLIGVTKTVGPEAVPALLDAGLRDFGENRWQHAKDMLSAPRAEEAVWHFIGHLQMNKVKYIVRPFAWIHSIDTVELAETISRQAEKAGVILNGLAQVNVSGESQKHGFQPVEVEMAVRRIQELPGLRLRGLMTMAPHTDNTEVVRDTFRGLRELQQNLLDAGALPEEGTELSMGMSEDYPVALEEGATMIRLGRVIMQPTEQ